MDITIRKATKSDLETIQQLNKEVFLASNAYDLHLNMNWPYSTEGVTYYKKTIEQEEYFCQIAELDGKPVGYLIGLINNYSYRVNKTGEIENMGVSPSFRGKGIGSQLVSSFKKWCKERQVDFVRVSTYFENPKAIEFYKKQGLLPIDVVLEGRIEE